MQFHQKWTLRKMVEFSHLVCVMLATSQILMHVEKMRDLCGDPTLHEFSHVQALANGEFHWAQNVQKHVHVMRARNVVAVESTRFDTQMCLEKKNV